MTYFTLALCVCGGEGAHPSRQRVDTNQRVDTSQHVNVSDNTGCSHIQPPAITNTSLNDLKNVYRFMRISVLTCISVI